ncbi:sigma 54-interacting transcriptional regulator [Pendulispora albinea]|uniref:Sigma 54-interacting transcriptional regulator n=1 Tax=Pendulispora albinea TaxID=2741071 RepID=A0ABZ2M2S1_9BACT
MPIEEGASTVLQSRPRGGFNATATFRLRVVEGPDAGREFVLDGTQPSRVLIGTSPACAFRLSDRQISRRHASIDVVPEGLRLTDLGSTNGTWANGLCVFDVRLHGGELVRLGDNVLRVEVVAMPAEHPTTLAMRFGRLVGASPEMRRLYPLCERLAATDVPVVIEGETGTGKELLAESIHEESAREKGPFVVFDCTTVAANLLESTLFGHERGAFTGAVAARRGVFEQAHGGTLLIDEIGDLDASLQSKLLRAIERNEVQRVGGEKFVRVDVRVMAATRRDLDKEVQAGRFRDDLFYRLAVARIELPPLRERRGDVQVLGRYFWEQLGGTDKPIPEDLLRRFEEYGWPGNVRELHNAIARRLALGDLAAMERSRALDPAPSQAPGADVIKETLAMDLPFPAARQRVMNAFERGYVERVLAKHGGNVVRAAAASGIARRYFYVIKSRQRPGGQENE